MTVRGGLSAEHEAGAKPYPNNIKYLIKLYGYKVVEVADELQILRSTHYDYISGNRPAPKECLRDIASFPGCDIGDFKTRVQGTRSTSHHAKPRPGWLVRSGLVTKRARNQPGARSLLRSRMARHRDQEKMPSSFPRCSHHSTWNCLPPIT